MTNLTATADSRQETSGQEFLNAIRLASEAEAGPVDASCIDRLRVSQRAYDQRMLAKGYTTGRAWATNYAEADQLDRLRYLHWRGLSGNGHDYGNIAEAIAPEEDWHTVFSELCRVGKSSPGESHTLSWQRGFVAGAAHFWENVELQL